MLLVGWMLGGCATKTQQMKTSSARVITLRESYNNVHIIKVKERLLMIDGGLEKSAPTIEARMKALGLNPAALVGVIVTHGHADHAGGARYFRDKYKVPVYAGHGDRALFASGKNDKLCPTGSRGQSRLQEDQLARYTPYEAVWVKRSMKLPAKWGLEGQIELVPGHTKGSLVIVVGDAAFVGDLFRGAIVGSSAETHFYMCDLANNRRDIDALLRKYPRVTTFFTGHFGPVDRAAVKAYLKRKN